MEQDRFMLSYDDKECAHVQCTIIPNDNIIAGLSPQCHTVCVHNTPRGNQMLVGSCET